METEVEAAGDIRNVISFPELAQPEYWILHPQQPQWYLPSKNFYRFCSKRIQLNEGAIPFLDSCIYLLTDIVHPTIQLLIYFNGSSRGIRYGALCWPPFQSIPGSLGQRAVVTKLAGSSFNFKLLICQVSSSGSTSLLELTSLLPYCWQNRAYLGHIIGVLNTWLPPYCLTSPPYSLVTCWRVVAPPTSPYSFCLATLLRIFGAGIYPESISFLLCRCVIHPWLSHEGTCTNMLPKKTYTFDVGLAMWQYFCHSLQ